VRYAYKTWPRRSPHPAFPNVRFQWIPILNVRLSFPNRRAQPTQLFEAVVDSGATYTLFDAGIARSIGIDVESGIPSEVGGLTRAAHSTIYFHNVNLHVATDVIRITAAFCEGLSVAGLLGRLGFFEHFVVTFDPAGDPPGLEIDRLPRA
jgi:hypothetical protein